MPPTRIVPIVLFVTAAACQTRPSPGPYFIDLQRVAVETVAGRSAAAEYQRGANDRQRRALEVDAAAKKLPEGSKERQAKESEAQQLAATLAQQNQAAGKAADEAFQKQVIEVAVRIAPAELILPIKPLAGGVDVTDQVIAKLNAANEDAMGKVKALADENERLRKALADRPPAPPTNKPKP